MKLYKVTVTISFGDCEGKCETGRETRTRFFESLEEAIFYSRWGGEEGFNSIVVKKQIWEYEISSIKELHQKEKEVIRQTKTVERVWE